MKSFVYLMLGMILGAIATGIIISVVDPPPPLRGCDNAHFSNGRWTCVHPYTGKLEQRSA